VSPLARWRWLDEVTSVRHAGAIALAQKANLAGAEELMMDLEAPARGVLKALGDHAGARTALLKPGRPEVKRSSSALAQKANLAGAEELMMDLEAPARGVLKALSRCHINRDDLRSDIGNEVRSSRSPGVLGRHLVEGHPPAVGRPIWRAEAIAGLECSAPAYAPNPCPHRDPASRYYGRRKRRATARWATRMDAGSCRGHPPSINPARTTEPAQYHGAETR
jgi:hypothetical protein